MQAINPMNNHTKFVKDRINTFQLENDWKPSVTMDGRRRTLEKAKIMSTPQWGGHNDFLLNVINTSIFT